jgi:hypothetical protein
MDIIAARTIAGLTMGTVIIVPIIAPTTADITAMGIRVETGGKQPASYVKNDSS